MKNDLDDFQIKLSFNEIKSMKKENFKKAVKEACKRYVFQKLLKLKEGHKKGSKIKYKKLEIQKYLLSDKISVKEAKLLFKIRTEMLDVRQNFKNKYIDKSKNDDYNEKLLSCPLCELHIDNAKNILKCSVLDNNNNDNDNDNFDDLYSEDMDKVSSMIKKFNKLWRQRQDLQQ